MNSINTGFYNHSLYNLTNTVLSGYSQINNVKLAQALSGKNTPAGAVNSAGPALSSNAASFLKSYQDKMTGMTEAADAVLRGEKTDKLAAAAENPDVAAVSGSMKHTGDEYAISVQQLASGQINRSTGFVSDTEFPAMSGSLHIRTEQGSFDVNLSAAGSKNNKEMLQKFASEINAKASGVTASVVEKDGRSHLELAGKSGEGNAFAVTGTLAGRLGLDTVAAEAKDAVYSVSKNGGTAQTKTSSTNNVAIGEGVAAKLKGTGETAIKAGADASYAAADALQNLVDSFNDTLGFLNKNADRGVGVLRQIKHMVLPPASEKSMALAGITIDNDGALRLDQDAFSKAMKESPSLTKEIVENIANGVKTDARQGMQISSQSLVGTQAAQRQSDALQNPINFMSMYSRSGVYNMANLYAVGALMNINI